MTRLTCVLVLTGLACGVAPVKAPFAALTPGGACSADADCAIGACPNACHLGQPFCTYPNVYLKADVEKACPCVKTPTAATCAAPTGEACGPQPGCAEPADAPLLAARCVSGRCVGQLPDGGVP